MFKDIGTIKVLLLLSKSHCTQINDVIAIMSVLLVTTLFVAYLHTILFSFDVFKVLNHQ